MVNCCDCKKWFRDNYSLKRHMSRLKPCCEKGSVEKGILIAENSTQNAVNNVLPALNNEKPTENDNHYCLWCDSTFSTKFNLKVHNDRCNVF